MALAGSQFKFNNNYTDDFGSNDLTAGGTGNTFDTTNRKVGSHALKLTGSGDARRSDVTDNISEGNHDRAITGWFRAGNSFNGQTLVALGTSSTNQEFTVQLDNFSGSHRMLVNMGSNNVAITLNNNLSLNTYYWLCVNYFSSVRQTEVFINNVSQGTEIHTSNSALAFPSANGLVVGDSLSLAKTNSFTGYLDDIRVYDATLSSTDRIAIYNSGNGNEGNANTGWKYPTASANVEAGVSNPNNAFAQDGSYATFNDATDATADYIGHDLSAAVDVKGIEVMITGKSRNSGSLVYLHVNLSSTGGSPYTSEINVSTTSGTNRYLIAGGPTELWGRTWTLTDLLSGNFTTHHNVDSTKQTTQYDIDAIPVRIFFTPPTTTSTSTSSSTTTTSTSTSTTTTHSTSTSSSTTTTSTSTTTSLSTTTSTSTTTTSTSTTTTSTSTTTTSTSTTTTSTSTSTSSSTSTSTTQTKSLALAVDHGD